METTHLSVDNSLITLEQPKINIYQSPIRHCITSHHQVKEQAGTTPKELEVVVTFELRPLLVLFNDQDSSVHKAL